MSLSDLRKEYTRGGLTEADADADALRQFARWFAEAQQAGLLEPNAMTLATATPDGRPAARMVLLKAFDAHGFVFFTNQQSPKARDLVANPRSALVFYWDRLERQVRITGTVSPVAPDESARYFATRPRPSQLGAWISAQSQPLANRAELEARFAEIEAQHSGESGGSGGDVPVPPHWGGYRVAPDTIEFWQGRPSRLHDRLLYTRQAGGAWTRQRLWP
jgi:pyridoxamine 5'-phosphate oxidase